MATLHITESDAARDLGALLDQVGAGVDIFIERADGRFAVLTPSDPTAPGFDPEYDAIIAAKIDRALADDRPALSSEEVEAYFAKRRAAAGEKTPAMTS